MYSYTKESTVAVPTALQSSFPLFEYRYCTSPPHKVAVCRSGHARCGAHDPRPGSRNRKVHHPLSGCRKRNHMYISICMCICICICMCISMCISMWICISGGPTATMTTSPPHAPTSLRPPGPQSHDPIPRPPRSLVVRCIPSLPFPDAPLHKPPWAPRDPYGRPWRAPDPPSKIWGKI